jgi:hypothetical protein
VIAVQVDRLRHISVANNLATIKEGHHHCDPLNLTPCAYAETLNGAAHRRGHYVTTVGSLQQGGTDGCCALASRQRGEFAARQRSKRRARSGKPHA